MEWKELEKIIDDIADDIRKYPDQLEIHIQRAYQLGYNLALKDVVERITTPKVNP